MRLLKKVFRPVATVRIGYPTAFLVLLLAACEPPSQSTVERREPPSRGGSRRPAARSRRPNRSATQALAPKRNAERTNAPGAGTESKPVPRTTAKPGSDSHIAAGPNRAGATPTPTTRSDEIPSADANPLPAIDEDRLAEAGLRKLAGEHITIVTDLPPSRPVDELPGVFDLAVDAWRGYFQVDPHAVEDWHVRAFLMDDREEFESADLLPANLPRFRHGYSRSNKLWIFDQPSDYYRRHLLLHEGTHVFMQTHLRGMGPPWYSEGMAELLGTHRWKDNKLQLRYFPQSRDEVPYWGRIKIVKSECAAGRRLSLEQVMSFGPTVHLKVEPYGWCWALTAFLDGHPRFVQRFRRLAAHVDESPDEFNARLRGLFGDDQRQLVEQWQLFVATLEYGYDIRREAILYESTRLDRDGTTIVEIRADRGWQSTGVVVSPGTSYVVEASGRYQLAREPKIWWSEPGGVTIRYHAGHPLGMLMAGVSDQAEPLSGITPLADPRPIGLQREIQFDQPGTLFLRINDSPADLDNNAGTLQVEIRTGGDAPSFNGKSTVR